MGHDVSFIAQTSKQEARRTMNKNDSADAEAICEAVQRPNMRFIPAKSIEQQDIQSLPAFGVNWSPDEPPKQTKFVGC